MNAKQAAERLNVDYGTLRRWIEGKGIERINAVRDEQNDWNVPESEIRRIEESRLQKLGIAKVGGQAVRLLESAWTAGTSQEQATVMWAAQKYVAGPDDATLKQLREAIESYESWRKMERLVSAVRSKANEAYTNAIHALSDPDESGEQVEEAEA